MTTNTSTMMPLAIPANYESTQDCNEKQVMHVFWQLTKKCNYSCPYCDIAGREDNCIFSLDRLLQMAWRILCLPQPLVHIEFLGGEPTLHPFLPEIIHYILHSGREALITLNTNGSSLLEQYMALAPGNMAARLRFVFAIHPCYPESSKILELIPQIARQGHHIKIVLTADAAYCESAKNIAVVLAALRASFPFHIELMFPDENETGNDCSHVNAVDWWKLYEKSFERIDNLTQNRASAWPELSPKQNICFLDAEGIAYCCSGVGSLYIWPNGMFGGTPCGKGRAEQPLWRAGAEDLAAVINSDPCESPCGKMPVFSAKSAADDFLAQHRLKLAEWFDNTQMLINPLNSEPTPDQLIRSAIKALSPLPQSTSCARVSLAAAPDLVYSRLMDIARVYDSLADQASREIYLRCLKAIKTGNSAFLPVETEAEWMDQDCSVPDKPGSYVAMIKLAQGLNQNTVQAYLGSVRQHLPKLDLRLKLAEYSLIDMILTILAKAPGYLFKLAWERHGYLHLIGINLLKHRSYRLPCASKTDIACEVMDKLQTMRPLRHFIKTINPQNTAVIVFKDVLTEAIRHYKKLLNGKLPDFVLANWDGGGRDAYEAMAAKLAIRIVPLKGRAELGKASYCLYGRISANLWDSGSFGHLACYCAWHGITDGYDIDAACATSLQWQWKPLPDLLNARFEDICAIYAATGDNESRETFLRVIKSRLTGDPGYLPVSSFRQYFHPLTLARESDIVIEGGLDNGETTKAFGRDVGSGGKVIGFEPVNASWERCVAATAGMANVVIEKLALWSGARSFFIEDRGGGSRLTDKPNERAEACQCIDLDSYLNVKGLRCDLIKLDIEGSEPYCLEGARSAIWRNMPKLHISIYHEPLHAIDIPLWILRNYPGYEFYFGHHTVWWGETLLYARRKPAHLVQPISFIVMAGSKPEMLAASLDSILLQMDANSEIVITGVNLSEDALAMSVRYQRLCPGQIQILELCAHTDEAGALNEALECCQGDYVIMLESGATLASAFAETGRSLLATSNADAVVFGNDQPAAEILDSFAALKWLAESGSDSPYGILLTRRLLVANNLHPQTGQTLAAFAIRALYYARGVAAVPFQGSFAPEKQVDGRKALAEFAVFSQWLAHFFEDHGLADRLSLQAAILRSYLAKKRSSILLEIRLADKKGNLARLLDEDILTKLGASRAALEAIILEYALVNAWRRKFSFGIEPEDRDWRAAASRPYIQGKPFPYGNAENPLTLAPVLTVIVPNYNHGQYLAKCLGSILSQSMRDFELIIVDDASTDDSWKVLTAWADCDPRIRLYRLDRNSRQGVCRNIGIDKARGKYLLFVDGDDKVESGYFEYGINLMESNGVDLGLFSYQAVSVDGNILEQQILADTQFDGGYCSELYMKGMFNGAPFAKIFRVNAVRACGARFAQHVYHQDHHFVGPMAKAAAKVIQSSFIAYSAVKTPDSSVRPSKFKYLYIHSAARFYEHMQKTVGVRLDLYQDVASAMLWSLDYIHLAAWHAFYKATGEVALADADYERLAKSTLFIFTLLMGYARIADGVNVPPEILGEARKRACFSDGRLPLLSVIIYGSESEEAVKTSLNSALGLKSLDIEVILPEKDWLAFEDWREFISANPKLRICGKAGSDYAASAALAVARGRYLTFLRAGCQLEPAFLPRALALLKLNPDADLAWQAPDWNYPDAAAGRETGKSLSGSDFALAVSPEILTEISGVVFSHVYLNGVAPDACCEIGAALAISALVGQGKVIPVDAPALKGPAPFLPDVKDLFAAASVAAALGEDAAERIISSLIKQAGKKVWRQAARLNREALAPKPGIAQLVNLILCDIAARKKLPAPIYDARWLPSAEPKLFLSASRLKKPKLLSVLLYAPGFARCLQDLPNALPAARDDFELLVIDDASHDGTQDAAASLAARDSRIQVCRLIQFAGKGQAFNLALSHAAGKYALFVDSASAFARGALSLILNEISDATGDMFSCGNPNAPGNSENSTSVWEACVSSFAERGRMHGLNDIVYSVGLLNKGGLRFDIHAAADDVFFARSLLFAHEHQYLNIPDAPQPYTVKYGINALADRVICQLALASELKNAHKEAFLAGWLKYLTSDASDLLKSLAVIAAFGGRQELRTDMVANIMQSVCMEPELLRLIFREAAHE